MSQKVLVSLISTLAPLKEKEWPNKIVLQTKAMKFTRPKTAHLIPVQLPCSLLYMSNLCRDAAAWLQD